MRSRRLTGVLRPSIAILCAAAVTASTAPAAAQAPDAPPRVAAAAGAMTPVMHRTIKIDGLDIFYREAGPKDAPVVLLLHGFPTSSHMFRNLIPALADRYHVVAPDFPGYGQSSMPSRDRFQYTFANLATITDHFAQALGLGRYTLYVMDYGAPVGDRLALAHP
jgi:alpha-beta hydrolase superfamily lysophospholipase